MWEQIFSGSAGSRFTRAPIARPDVPDLDAAGAQIDQLAAFHRVVAAAVAERNAVSARMTNCAVAEHDIPRADGRDGRIQPHLSLRIRLAFRRKQPVRMRERQTLKPDVGHPCRGLQVALEIDNPVECRRDDYGRIGLLPRLRDIGEHTARPIEVPLARLAHRLLDVHQEEAVVLWEPVPT